MTQFWWSAKRTRQIRLRALGVKPAAAEGGALLPNHHSFHTPLASINQAAETQCQEILKIPKILLIPPSYWVLKSFILSKEMVRHYSVLRCSASVVWFDCPTFGSGNRTGLLFFTLLSVMLENNHFWILYFFKKIHKTQIQNNECFRGNAGRNHMPQPTQILVQTHTPHKSGSISFRKIRILLIRPKDLSSFRFSGAARQMLQGSLQT